MEDLPTIVLLYLVHKLRVLQGRTVTRAIINVSKTRNSRSQCPIPTATHSRPCWLFESGVGHRRGLCQRIKGAETVRRPRCIPGISEEPGCRLRPDTRPSNTCSHRTPCNVKCQATVIAGKPRCISQPLVPCYIWGDVDIPDACGPGREMIRSLP